MSYTSKALCALFGILFLLMAIVGFMCSSSIPEEIIASVFLLVCSIVLIVLSIIKPTKPTNFKNPYLDSSAYEQGIIPKINYPSLILNRGETLYFACPASIVTYRNQVVGYTGGSRGVSINVAKGVDYRVGGSDSRAIRADVAENNFGDYIVTNQRLVFIGKKGSFEIPVYNVTAVLPAASNIFRLVNGNNSYNIMIHPTQIPYAIALSSQAAKDINSSQVQQDEI